MNQNNDITFLGYYSYEARRERFLLERELVTERNKALNTANKLRQSLELLRERRRRLEEQQLICNICLEMLDSQGRDITRFQCGHTYCTSCVNQLRTNTCPSCRQIITRQDKLKL